MFKKRLPHQQCSKIDYPKTTNIKLKEYNGTWHIKDYFLIYPLGFHLLEYDDENTGDILVYFLDNGEYEIVLTDVKNPKDELITYLFPKGGCPPLPIEKNKFKRFLIYILIILTILTLFNANAIMR